MNRARRRIGLQGWLIAAFVAVGLAASLTLVLVLLPTLESSIRSDRATAEARRVSTVLAGGAAQLGAMFPGNDAGRILRHLDAEVGGPVYLIDPEGGVVASRNAAGGPPALREIGVALRLGESVNSISRVGDNQVAIVTQAIKRYGTPVGALQSASVVRGVGEELSVVRRRVLLAVIAVIALASLAGFALSRALGRRIRGLATTAATLARGDLSARSPVPQPQELTTLGESLNTMASRLEGLVAETVSDRDRANALIGSLAEGVVAVSPTGELTVINEAAQRHLGLAPGGGARLEALPAPVADAVREVLGEPASAGRAHEVDLPGVGVFALLVTPLPDRAEGVVLTLRDVTDERRLERARRDLVANVSHELKTPLAALTGFIELLEDPRLDPARRREFVALMAGEAARLDRLVEEQLELARMDSGRLPLDLEPVALGELAVRVCSSRQALAAREGVTLSADEGPDGVLVSADAARVEQILLILLDNAMRHTPPGGSVRVAAGREDGTATLSVADSGEGIAPQAQPFVFDRFYQADPSREGRGAGLGLAIARSLAQAHGGAIELRSVEGMGSTFTLRLPLVPGSRATETGDRPGSPTAA